MFAFFRCCRCRHLFEQTIIVVHCWNYSITSDRAAQSLLYGFDHARSNTAAELPGAIHTRGATINGGMRQSQSVRHPATNVRAGPTWSPGHLVTWSPGHLVTWSHRLSPSRMRDTKKSVGPAYKDNPRQPKTTQRQPEALGWALQWVSLTLARLINHQLTGPQRRHHPTHSTAGVASAHCAYQRQILWPEADVRSDGLWTLTRSRERRVGSHVERQLAIHRHDFPYTRTRAAASQSTYEGPIVCVQAERSSCRHDLLDCWSHLTIGRVIEAVNV
jgi:hypothetical protein